MSTEEVCSADAFSRQEKRVLWQLRSLCEDSEGANSFMDAHTEELSKWGPTEQAEENIPLSDELTEHLKETEGMEIEANKLLGQMHVRYYYPEK